MASTTAPTVGANAPEKIDAPVIVGLYGLPGAGKSFMLDQLKQRLGRDDFAFYDGSDVIGNVVPGGLTAFQQLDRDAKVRSRELAIRSVREDCAKRGCVGVVAGHFMFWMEGATSGSVVGTPQDLATYTHIIYLSVPAEVVAQRCKVDKARNRPILPIDQLRKWQSTEKTQLRSLCREHGILFSVLVPSPTAVQRVEAMLRDFCCQSEAFNVTAAEQQLDEAIATNKKHLQTVLVLDGDKTLAANDTGAQFWEELSARGVSVPEKSPLKELFGSPLKHTYLAFRQATYMYEDATDDRNFDGLCEDVAARVDVYPDFVRLLRRVAEAEHVEAIVITCGLRSVWEKVLTRHGLSGTVKVLGGGRIADGIVVNANVKEVLVQRLRTVHKLYVWAFGDSPLDLGMLAAANEAVVVVGEAQTRSTTMDSLLRHAIAGHILQARQTLIPKHVLPRLSESELPLVDLTDTDVLDSVFCIRQDRSAGLRFVHSTAKKAAKVLMTPMRDCAIAGPALREAHRRVGRYLAIEYLTEIMGIEEYPTRHVQGHSVPGFRLHRESQTLIVALMRGGEPMALGVNEVLPLASFLHATHSSDIEEHHLLGQDTVVLVDSVINSGKTVHDFAQRVRSLHETVRIVVVAGVVQAGFVSTSDFTTNVDLIALRVSENNFKGQGGTDTGNRLFNTTQLP